MSRFTRRTFLGGAATVGAASALGLRPRPALAAVPPRQRKFLFLFAGGGWDTTQVFDPHFGSDAAVDMAPGTVLGSLGDLRWTAGPDRPSVSRFFQRWGHRTAVVNGVATHSIGHDSGRRFVMTGSSASSLSDWPTLLASNTEVAYPMPHVVFSGPAFAGNQGSAVVRGGGGLLVDLIDGSIVSASDLPAPAVARPVDAMVDAWVYERTAEFARGRQGAGRRRAEDLLASVERSVELEGRQFEAGLGDIGRTLLQRASRATELMRLGLSRCAMVSIPGGWDTHGNNLPQGPQFEDLFDALDRLMDRLATTPGHSGATLADEIVIVALSELGRTPRLNGGGGKDHWPFTSGLVVGPGVAGGRVVGRTDDGLMAVPIDFSTGHPSASGDSLGCENLGATLLAMGGVDPDAFLQGVQLVGALRA